MQVKPFVNLPIVAKQNLKRKCHKMIVFVKVLKTKQYFLNVSLWFSQFFVVFL